MSEKLKYSINETNRLKSFNEKQERNRQMRQELLNNFYIQTQILEVKIFNAEETWEEEDENEQKSKPEKPPKRLIEI